MSTGFVSIKRIFKDKNLFLCRWIDSPNIEMHVQGSITHKSENLFVSMSLVLMLENTIYICVVM